MVDVRAKSDERKLSGEGKRNGEGRRIRGEIGAKPAKIGEKGHKTERRGEELSETKVGSKRTQLGGLTSEQNRETRGPPVRSEKWQGRLRYGKD